MSDLQALQNKFQHYLMTDEQDFKSYIVDTAKVNADTRMVIYKNAYRIRLIDALEANFPMLKIYLGDEQFVDLSTAYIEHYPSTFRSIRWFGDQLAAFLSSAMPYRDIPSLAEFAAFEWIMTLVFDAADANLLSVEEVTAIAPDAWPEIQFSLHPSVHRIDFVWNTAQIWQALGNNEKPPAPIKFAEPVAWVLWRKNLTNHFCSIPQDEAWAIDAVQQNKSFGEICEGLCQWVNEDEAGLRAASLLKGWIQSGLLRNFS